MPSLDFLLWHFAVLVCLGLIWWVHQLPPSQEES